jgi:hypothetical protein
MNKPPRIRNVRAVQPFSLEIEWTTGETLRVDVERLLKRFKLYEPVRNPRAFRLASADAWGHAVTWPGEIDIGADTLYELSREQAGEWGPEKFDAWMQRNGLSLTAAAEALDMTRRMIAHYRTGSRPIPRVVALACEGWEARQRNRRRAA